jgi:tetratricopeptide (TPR) repeat protein
MGRKGQVLRKGEVVKGASEPGPRLPQIEAKLKSREWLQLAAMLFEKCELRLAQQAYEEALAAARSEDSPRAVGEALVGLLRYASETLNAKNIERWSGELNAWAKKEPNHVPSEIWYSLGFVANIQRDYSKARRYLLFYLRSSRRDQRLSPREKEIARAKGFSSLAQTLSKSGEIAKSEKLAHLALARYLDSGIRGILQVLYGVLEVAALERDDYPQAIKYCRQSQAICLQEHNWYAHLYVLSSYAYIARKMQDFELAKFHLELIERAIAGEAFGRIRLVVEQERQALLELSADVEIDADRGVVRTRETDEIPFGKQYILLEIVKALYLAHARTEGEGERGLTKAEIIQQVWKENYRPEAHDNKLYYNINRLRKLIEPDAHHPQYVQNWKDGYRFAPHLKIREISESQKGREQ